MLSSIAPEAAHPITRVRRQLTEHPVGLCPEMLCGAGVIEFRDGKSMPRPEPRDRTDEELLRSHATHRKLPHE